MPQHTEIYGHDRFIIRDGQRLRTRMVRTVQPLDGETNANFERRMDAMAAALGKMEKVQSVELEFERRKNAIVQCTIDVQHVPYRVFVMDDESPAGGRSGGGRGQRAA